MSGPRIVLTGGGTGGHIYPALAVADSLRRACPPSEILFIGRTAGMEQRLAAESGLRFEAIAARKMRKLASPETILVVLSLLRAIFRARAILSGWRPAVVLSTGGYVAGGVALAAVTLRIPVVVLEGNAVAGRTNRLLGRFAGRICLMFDETAASFPKGSTAITGMPVRDAIVRASREPKTAAFPHMEAGKLNILVIGGSQGSRALNDILAAAAPRLCADGVAVLHQIGEANAEALAVLPAEGGARYRRVPYLNNEELVAAYRAAGLVICRGGISTLSEILAYGVPAVVVPLPSAYADHQSANARALERQNAAIMSPETDTTPDSICALAAGLIADPARLAALAAGAARMGRPDSADAIASLLLSYAGGPSERQRDG